MNRIIKNAMTCLLVGLIPVVISGCAAPAAQTGFLKDYSKLQPHPDINGRHRYINPKMNAGDYSKFIVDPVVLSLSETGKEREVDQEDLNEQVTFFHQKIVEELEKDYQVVSSPGKGVARVRVAITDVEKTLPFLGLHQVEWVSAIDQPLPDRAPVPQNGSRWPECNALYCESRDCGF